jgi:phospholipid transport system substrate-binding protein
VADVLGVINSGRGESAMLRDFERIFRDYADVPIIAQSVVGPPWRGPAPATARLRRRIPGLHGAEIRAPFPGIHRRRDHVTGLAPGAELRRGHLDRPHARLRAVRGALARLRRLGPDRFFNMIIEGVNLMITERSEIGTMLDARGGDLGRLASDLRSLG